MSSIEHTEQAAGASAPAGRRALRLPLRRGVRAVQVSALAILIAVLCAAGLAAGQWTGALCIAGCTAGATSPTWQLSSLTAYSNTLLTAGSTIWAGTNDGLWVTKTAGAMWQRAGLGGQSILTLAQAKGPGLLVAGMENGDVLLRAENGRWHSTGLRLGEDHPIFSLAISPDGRTILAGVTGALYRGRRSGALWSWRRVLKNDQSAFTTIVWAPWNSSTVYTSAFSYVPAVQVSHDSGGTWQPFTAGLPGAVPSQQLLPLPQRRIILTTMGGGVWQWTGSRWIDISRGLPERHAMPIVRVAGHPDTFYTGTMGFGVYTRKGFAPWRRIGQGLQDGAHTVLGLAYVRAPHPTLLAATALGVFELPLPARQEA